MRFSGRTAIVSGAAGDVGRLLCRGLAREGARVLQTGLAEASVLVRKIGSFGDPRLYALLAAAEKLANSAQPLVPERVFVAGANGENGQAANVGQGLLGMLVSLLVAEKSGFQPAGDGSFGGLEEMADRMSRAHLSMRELDVLRLMLGGKRNREIASALDITEGTVKLHVSSILGKLGVADRTEAVTVALQRGIVQLDR